MPHIDHAALWVTDLDGARDFYSHWFNGHSNGLYENPRTGLRTYILHFTDGPWEERRTRLELMSRPDVAAPAEAAVLDPEGNRVELLAGDYSDDVALRPSH